MPSPKRKRLTAPDRAELAENLREKLRPVVICISHAWGGLEQICARDAMELARLGIPVRFVCLPFTPLETYLRKQTDLKTLTIEPLDFKPRDVFDFGMRREIRRWVGQQGINLIHCHQPSLLGSLSPWLWRHPRVSLVVSRHIMNHHNKRNPYHAFVYRRVDALVGMSEALRQNILNTHLIRDRQVKVIHYGLDFEYFNPDRVNGRYQRETWGANPDTILVGLVGRIDPAKGQDILIRAAALISQMKLSAGSAFPKVKFVIVGEETRGSDRKYLTELEDAVTRYQLDGKVIFTGFHKNIPEVMAALDICVMPSQQETFGMVAIEAMAMECPVVISKGGSAEEVIGKISDSNPSDSGQAPEVDAGLLVRPNDPFDLAQKLLRLIEDPDLRKRMGQMGAAWVRDQYDFRDRTDRTMSVYERLLRIRGA